MLPQSNREKEIFRVTWTGSIVNFALLVFKFVAGFVVGGWIVRLVVEGG